MDKLLRAVLAALFLVGSLTFPPKSSAQMILLPEPGVMVPVSPVFMPALIKGIRILPNEPLKFDFIIDKGQEDLKDEALRVEADKLVKYFLATLTVPKEELWVNLSPYEKDRIVPDSFGRTEMGRDLLAQDYLLKQLTASLIYPEDELGQQFWSRVQKLAYERFGTTEIPVNTFNKVWVVPQKAVVYENGEIAFVVEARLKVMLEEDYLATQQATMDEGRGTRDENAASIVHPPSSLVAKQVLREVIVPEIEREVNEGKNFAQLRQIYYSMILATWFKRHLREGILNQVYIDQNKIEGVKSEDEDAKQKIYEQYLKAFEKGVYNYIREDLDPSTQEYIPRKYFSGGAKMGDVDKAMMVVRTPQAAMQAAASIDRAIIASIGFKPHGEAWDKDPADAAMLNESPGTGIPPLKITDSDLEASTVIGAGSVPEWLRFVLAYYETQNDVQTLTKIKELIRAGRLRAGPQHSQRKGGMQDGNTHLIYSTAEDLNPDVTLVELMAQSTAEISPEQTPEYIQKYKDWQRKIKGQTISNLAQHSQGVVASLMRSFHEAGIFELFKDSEGGYKTIRVSDIIEHIKRTKGLDVYRNRQYLHGALSELAALGWLTRRGFSASDAMRLSLTDKGKKALSLNFPAFYANVAQYMPRTLDMSAYLLESNSGTGNDLQAVAELAKRGWDIPAEADPELAQELREHLNGFLVGALMIAMQQLGIFERFDIDLMFNTDRYFGGNNDRLRSAFDIFETVGFVVRHEEIVKMTPLGVAMFSRALSHGVPVSYSPSYSLVETFLFGDLKTIQRRDMHGRELLVFRALNVIGSGEAHKTYFRQTDKILINVVNEKVKKGEIPSLDELRVGAGFYEFTVADTGAGDGTWLERIYNVILNQTEYGRLMQEHPEQYKLKMIGIDYNPEPLVIIQDRLDRAKIPNIVIRGDINRPQDIGYKLAKSGITGKVNIHVSSMLIHNRPYTGVKDKLAAKRRQKEGALSNGAFGWRGRAIPNGELEQNLYEFFKAWGEIADEMIIIELHTIDEEVAARNLKKTLDIAYRWSHLLSDQFIVEAHVFKAIAEEAGFESRDVTLNPPAPELVTVTTRRLVKKAPLQAESVAAVEVVETPTPAVGAVLYTEPEGAGAARVSAKGTDEAMVAGVFTAKQLLALGVTDDLRQKIGRDPSRIIEFLVLPNRDIQVFIDQRKRTSPPVTYTPEERAAVSTLERELQRPLKDKLRRLQAQFSLIVDNLETLEKRVTEESRQRFRETLVGMEAIGEKAARIAANRNSKLADTVQIHHAFADAMRALQGLMTGADAPLRVDLDESELGRLRIRTADDLGDGEDPDEAMEADPRVFDQWRTGSGVQIISGGRPPEKRYVPEEDILEITDENGQRTGQEASKYDAHDKELWHMTAYILLKDSQGRVLIPKRALRRAISAGKFQLSVTEHVQKGESIVHAAVRGAKEELGIVIDPERLTPLTLDNEIKRSYDLEIGQNKEHTTIFAYRVSDADLQQMAEAYDNTENEEFWLVPYHIFQEMLHQNPEMFSRSFHYLAEFRKDILGAFRTLKDPAMTALRYDQIDYEKLTKPILVGANFDVVEGGKVKDPTKVIKGLAGLKDIDHPMVFVTHNGRPLTQGPNGLELDPILEIMRTEMPGKVVKMASGLTGPRVAEEIKSLKRNEVLLLTNFRLDHRAEATDEAARKSLVREIIYDADGEVLFSLFISNAFASAPRFDGPSPSTSLIDFPDMLPSAIGPLMLQEVNMLRPIREITRHPFILMTGGAKIGDKIDATINPLKKMTDQDILIIYGQMAFTYLQAQADLEGRFIDLGNSLIEWKYLDKAKEILLLAKERGVRVILPLDHVETDNIKNPSSDKTGNTEGISISKGLLGGDIGRQTIDEIRRTIKEAKLIFVNGTPGVFKTPGLDEGTKLLALALAEAHEAGIEVIVGGGDAVDSLKFAGVAERIPMQSTGGGSAIQIAGLKEGEEWAPMVALNDAADRTRKALKDAVIGDEAMTARQLLDAFDRMLYLNSSGQLFFASTDPIIELLFDLWFVRHGETDGNVLKVFQGDTDEPMNQLNDDGRRQAKVAAAQLYEQLAKKIEDGEDIVILTSPLTRAMEMAKAFRDLVRERTGRTLMIHVEDEAREINFGLLNNLTKEQAIAAGMGTLVERASVLRDATVKTEGGESFVDLLKRAFKWMKRLNERFAGKTVVLFGHGTYSSAMRVLLGDQRMKEAAGHINWGAEFLLPNGKPIRLSVADAAMAGQAKSSPEADDPRSRSERLNPPRIVKGFVRVLNEVRELQQRPEVIFFAPLRPARMLDPNYVTMLIGPETKLAIRGNDVIVDIGGIHVTRYDRVFTGIDEFHQKSGNEDPAMAAKDLGGIDMNPDLLKLETRGKGVDFQIDPAQLQNMPITGFSPIIYSITPVANLPFLLGLTDTEDKEEVGYKEEQYALEPEDVGLLQ